jgi:dienelactone hydrolase
VIGTVLALLVLARGPLLFLARGGLHLPAPSGPHAVGRVTWHIVSQDRPEQFTEDPDDTREIRADVYYPAEANSDAPAGVYIEPSIAEGATGMPAFFTSAIRPNWREGAKPAAGRPWPVLVFSPGIDGPPVFYTTLLEQIASHGYVVVALWHPYTTSRTIFPDGRIVESTFEGNGAMWTGDDAAREVPKQRVSEVWARDAVMALDEATRRNETDALLGGCFDLTRAGVFGHSFGGQNAAAAMTLDTRFRAGLNMDGTAVYKPIVDEGVTGAFAFVYDTFEPPLDYLAREDRTVESWWDEWSVRNCPKSIREKASPCFIFQVDGMAHEGFSTDLAWFRPLFPWVIDEEMVGDVPGLEAIRVVSDLIAGFFDSALSGLAAPILESPEAVYPRLHLGILGHPDPAIGR